jgi:hypothetical protein
MSLRVGSKSNLILYRFFRFVALTLIGILDLSFADHIVAVCGETRGAH